VRVQLSNVQLSNVQLSAVEYLCVSNCQMSNCQMSNCQLSNTLVFLTGAQRCGCRCWNRHVTLLVLPVYIVDKLACAVWSAPLCRCSLCLFLTSAGPHLSLRLLFSLISWVTCPLFPTSLAPPNSRACAAWCPLPWVRNVRLHWCARPGLAAAPACRDPVHLQAPPHHHTARECVVYWCAI